MLALAGCTNAAEDAPAVLHIEPANVTVTIVDGTAQTSAFRATLVTGDGSSRDVTAETQLSLENAAFGTWSGAALRLDGSVLGNTHVLATYDDQHAEAELSVFAQTSRFDDVDTKARDLFAAATVDTSCSPTLTYPLANTVLPRGMRNLSVHWADAQDDLFEVALSTTYADVRIYTHGLDPATPFFTLVPDGDLAQLAGQHEPINVRVSGMIEGSPATACKSTTQRMFIAEQAMTGGLFWTGNGITVRYNATQDSVSGMFESGAIATTATTPLDCTNCTLTNDGTRIAISGKVWEFASQTLYELPATWTTATFDPIGAKLVVAEGGALSLISSLDGETLATPASDAPASDPQMAPDGTRLVHVESFPTGDAIVIRSFHNALNVIGDADLLVGLVDDVKNTSPAWSPDGAYIAFTRTTPDESSIWIVKADGSESPKWVMGASDATVRARWAPTRYTVDGNRFYYLTFESTAAVGAVPAGGHQIWAMPFFVDTETFGAPFHLPMQPLPGDNRLVQWTTAIVE